MWADSIPQQDIEESLKLPTKKEKEMVKKTIEKHVPKIEYGRYPRRKRKLLTNY